MSGEGEGRDAYPFYATALAGVGLLGILGAYFLPRTPIDRWSAFLGVGSAAFSGAVALPLKQKAVSRSLQAALQVVGLIFGLRVVLVLVGLYLVRTHDGETLPFVAGFFTVYFAMQSIEIKYLVGEQNRRGPGE